MATNFENYELQTSNKSLVGGINELHSSATALTARVKVVEDLVGTGETGETLVERVTGLETLVGSGFGETDITEKVSAVESELDGLKTVVTAETTGLTAKVGALETESERVEEVLGEATSADLSKLHSLTVSAAELNYMSGVTGNVQTQLESKVSNAAYTAYTAATQTALDAKLTAVTVDSGLSVSNTAATAKISLKLVEDGGLGFDENNALKVTLDTQVFKVETSLPQQPQNYLNKIVLVPSSSSTASTNVYTEYIAVSSGDTYVWEILGEYDSHVDLTPYAKKSELSGVTVTSTTGSFIASVSTDENGKVSATTRQIEAADIPELEISKVSGLQSALDSKQGKINPDSSITLSEGAISVSTAYTSWVNGTVESAKTELNNTLKTVSGQVETNKTDIAKKQDKLSAGNGIELSTGNTVSAKIKPNGGLVLGAEGLSVNSSAYATKDSVDTLSGSVVSLESSKQNKAFTGHSSFTAITVEGALDELKAQVVAAETVVITGWSGLASALGESTSDGTAFVSGTTPENMYVSLTGAVTNSKDILIKVGASATAKVLFANAASDTVTMHSLVNNRLAYITVTEDEFGVSFLQFA